MKVKGMTNLEFESFLKLVIEVIKSSETKEEAVEKIEALMK